MIYSVTGNLVHTEPGAAVVDVGGVAFRCMTSMNTLRSLPRLSEKVTLYTYLNVREDALDLFGFATKGELSCFRLLTSISGVGPKVGLGRFEPALSRGRGFGRRRRGRQALYQGQRRGAEAGSAHCAGAEGQGEGPLRRRPCGRNARAGGPSASGNASQAVGALVTLGVFGQRGRRRRGPVGQRPAPGGIDPPGAEELWQREMTIS